MGNTSGSLEGVLVVPTFPHRHSSPKPIPGQKSEYPRYHPTPFQYLQGASLVQRVLGLVEINKDLVEELLLHGHNMLEEFGL